MKLRRESLQSKSRVKGFWASLKTKPVKPQLLPATETNLVDEATEVEDDPSVSRRETGSSKENSSKEKETPAQNKLRAELGKINNELASYTCIKSFTCNV